MRIQLVFLLFAVLAKPCFAQQELFYFLAEDTHLLGVKDGDGNTIIAAKHINFSLDEQDLLQAIRDRIITLVPKEQSERKPPYSYGLAYNRAGEVLYAPYLVDNGPDFLEEGLSRFVENGKIGFVDRNGSKVIAAQWDWVSPFAYGIAKACTNCFVDYAKDPEHPPFDLSQAQIFYIDKQGEIIKPLRRKRHDKDQQIDAIYLPYQFHYTTSEQALLKKMRQHEMRISKAFFVRYQDKLTPEEKVLHFEIIERPSSDFAYYVIQAFRYSHDGQYLSTAWYLMFYADEAGNIYVKPYFEDEEQMPLAAWLLRYEAEAQQYMEAHPGAVNAY